MGVERQLGLNSKREIEEFGLAERAAAARSSSSPPGLDGGLDPARPWMDWGNDYFTFSDTNIEYIWRFLRRVHERAGSTSATARRSGARAAAPRSRARARRLYVDRPTRRSSSASRCSSGRARRSWSGRRPRGRCRQRRRRGQARRGVRPARERRGSRSVATRTRRSSSGSAARSSSAGAIPARSTTCRRARASSTGDPWEDVTLDDGTGIVHIAPGAAPRTSSSAASTTCPCCPGRRGRAVLRRVRLAARALDGRGGRADHRLSRGARPPRRGRPARAPLPECWRCYTPLIFRISDDWFIAVDELRQQLRDANAKVEWTPAYMGKRMDDWLVNMGDWNISRRRYYGLPPCSTPAAAAT